jgi:hypothetical protein
VRKNKAVLGRRGAAIVLGVVIATGLGATAIGAQRGDDNPETVCHKPGTAAAHELTFDNDALVQAHLRHGDTLGSCEVAVTPTTPTAPPTEPVAEPGAAPAATAVAATPSLTG